MVLIPSDINLNEFISEFDYIDKIKHYKQQQVNNNIPIFGRYIKTTL